MLTLPYTECQEFCFVKSMLEFPYFHIFLDDYENCTQITHIKKSVASYICKKTNRKVRENFQNYKSQKRYLRRVELKPPRQVRIYMSSSSVCAMTKTINNICMACSSMYRLQMWHNKGQTEWLFLSLNISLRWILSKYIFIH